MARRLLPKGMEGLSDDGPADTDSEMKTEAQGDGVEESEKKTPKVRHDVSLFHLTQKFMDIIKAAPEGIVHLTDVARLLGVGKRRVYDITNALDGIRLIEKKSKNMFQWVGSTKDDPGTQIPELQRIRNDLSNLSAMEEALDDLLRDCAHQLFRLTEDRTNKRFAYVTYQDVQHIADFREQIVIAVKAPEETRLEIPPPTEKCIEFHMKSTKGPIDVLLCEVDQGNEDQKVFEKLTKTLKMDPEPIVIEDD